MLDVELLSQLIMTIIFFQNLLHQFLVDTSCIHFLYEFEYYNPHKN